jgi:hypothetical protein
MRPRTKRVPNRCELIVQLNSQPLRFPGAGHFAFLTGNVERTVWPEKTSPLVNNVGSNWQLGKLPSWVPHATVRNQDANDKFTSGTTNTKRLGLTMMKSD